MNEEARRIPLGPELGDMSALVLRPSGARWMLVLGHGAGAGMRHPFMEAIADRLADRRIGTLRYQFPYMERGSRRPDARGVLLATVRAACDLAAEAFSDLPLLAGGKSMGGRMTSLAASEGGLSQVRGLVFFGFPLHPAGRPSVERAAHLAAVSVPMLFLQGTRDALADLNLLRPICEGLPGPVRLHVVDDADHSFHVRKRTGRSDDDVLDELADVTADWSAQL